MMTCWDLYDMTTVVFFLIEYKTKPLYFPELPGIKVKTEVFQYIIE